MKCADKVTYETRGEAYDFLKTTVKANKHKHRHSLVIYQCPCCGKWHLTHKRQERFKARLANRLYDYKNVLEQ